jgi:hypothetical protein
MVLAFSDIPSGFAKDSDHHVGRAQAKKENGGWLAPGYRTGWEAKYSRQTIVGIVEILSWVSLYRTAAQAHASLREGYRYAARSHHLKRLSVGSSLGDEARMYRYQTKTSGYQIIVYVLSWRSHNIKAAVVAAGILGTVDPGRVVRLARKQQARILAAI